MREEIEIVSRMFPIPLTHLDYYFDALRDCRGVYLRHVVEAKKNREWDNNGTKEKLAEGYTVIAYKGPARRVLNFELAVAKEKLNIRRVHP